MLTNTVKSGKLVKSRSIFEYQLAEQKCAELTNVCEKLHGTKRGSHLVAVYDAKLKDTKDRRDHLGVILKAMDAAED